MAVASSRKTSTRVRAAAARSKPAAKAKASAAVSKSKAAPKAAPESKPPKPAKPIELHYWPTPNGWKIAIMLEECGTPYEARPVNIGRGEQFTPEFLKLSPNNRIPAILDPDGPGGKPISIFESGAILQYLGRKTGKFYPADERGRAHVRPGRDALRAPRRHRARRSLRPGLWQLFPADRDRGGVHPRYRRQRVRDQLRP